MKLFDVSVRLSEQTPAFPRNPPFSCEGVKPTAPRRGSCCGD